MLTIGPYTLPSRALLAPMAGVTDAPFRELSCKLGAGLGSTEMLTSDISLWKSDKSRLRLARVSDTTTPRSVQIAGSEPDMLAQAAEFAVTAGAQIIDINMGCPAKKVCKKLAGSALMRDEKLVANILASVVARVSVPVTLKTRTGWDSEHKNARNIAKIAENEGIKALTVHGRTRACRFNGNAEYDTIAEIVSSVSIPVIANGDVTCDKKACQVLDYTGAAGIMVGRAAFGNPWIFREINYRIQRGTSCAAPDAHAVRTVMIEHLQGLHQLYGETKGCRIARKHFAWYCQKHFPEHIDMIQVFNAIESSQSQLEAVHALGERSNSYEEKVA